MWRLTCRCGSFPAQKSITLWPGSALPCWKEEVGKFVAASEKGDLVGIADALADIVYVVYGTALTYGLDLDAVLREVHRSNMSKLGSDGKPLIRDDGKVKDDSYRSTCGGRPVMVTAVPATTLPLTTSKASERERKKESA